MVDPYCANLRALEEAHDSAKKLAASALVSGVTSFRKVPLPFRARFAIDCCSHLRTNVQRSALAH